MSKGGKKKRKSLAVRGNNLFLKRFVASDGLVDSWLSDLTLQTKIKKEGWDAGVYNHHTLR